METALTFEGHPGRRLNVWLFADVGNCSAIADQVASGTLQPQLALLNAPLVPDLIVLRAAAHKALTAEKRGCLRTKSLHAELVYSISGSKHISESLNRFGVNESCSSLLVARFDTASEHADSIKALVQGRLIDIAELPSLIDAALVTKEMKVGSITDAILCRIAARDC